MENQLLNNETSQSIENKGFIRGRRARIPILYDDFLFEREKLDNVLKKFMRKRRDVDSQDV